MNYRIHELISPIKSGGEPPFPKKSTTAVLQFQGSWFLLVATILHPLWSWPRLRSFMVWAWKFLRVKLWLWLDPLEMARVRMLGPFKRKLDVFNGRCVTWFWGKMKSMKSKRGEFWVWGWNVEDCNPLEQSIQKTKPIHVLSSQNWRICFFRNLKKQTENKDVIRAFEIHWVYWNGFIIQATLKNISLKSIEVIGLVKRLYHAAETWQANLEVGCSMIQQYGS